MNQSNAVPLAIVVVDESLAMAAVVGEPNASGTPSHLTTAERVATAVNSLLGQFAAGPACDVAVIGYRADAAGVADVGCRWGGALADRQWIGSVELAGVARRESRTRRMPLPGGGFKETVVEFSVWYEPVLGVKPAQVEAWRFCKQLLDKRVADASHPLAAVVILHVFAGMSADGSPQQSIAAITTMALPAGPSLDDVAGFEVGMVRLEHAAHRATHHHAADLDRRRIGFRRTHTAAHVGVEGEKERFQQNFAGPGQR